MTDFLGYVGIAVVVVAVLALGCWLMWQALEGSRLAFAGTALWLVLILAILMWGLARNDNTGPCLLYETRQILVGKVLTPYRVCVERGEWMP